MVPATGSNNKHKAGAMASTNESSDQEAQEAASVTKASIQAQKAFHHPSSNTHDNYRWQFADDSFGHNGHLTTRKRRSTRRRRHSMRRRRRSLRYAAKAT